MSLTAIITALKAVTWLKEINETFNWKTSLVHVEELKFNLDVDLGVMKSRIISVKCLIDWLTHLS